MLADALAKAGRRHGPAATATGCARVRLTGGKASTDTRPQGGTQPVFKKRSKRFWAVVAVILAAVIFVLPALIAFRYTAASQRVEFIKQPWRGWSFLAAALAVPADSHLKTSGQALRKAVWLYKGSVADPREIQLLFVTKDKPYAFTQVLAGRSITTTVVPAYRFIWQISGRIDTLAGSGTLIIGLLDYQTGKLLYDIRNDLPAQFKVSPPSDTPSPSPSAP
jgi:hypothetical protein